MTAASFARGDVAGVKPSHPTTSTSTSTIATATIGAPVPVPPWLARTGKLASGWEALEKGDFATAEADLKTVTGADSARATLGLARVAYEAGKLADAETLAKKASSQAGSALEIKYDATAWAAKSLLARGKLDEARKLVEPLRDELKAPRARSLLVEIMLRQGQRDDARNVTDALDGDSEGDDIVFKDPAMLAVVGRAAHLTRQVKFANATFKEASRLQKKHVETNLEWAALFLDFYDVGHAKECLRDIKSVAPDHPRTHLLAADIALADNFDWDTAEKEIALALKANPALPRAHFLAARWRCTTSSSRPPRSRSSPGSRSIRTISNCSRCARPSASSTTTRSASKRPKKRCFRAILSSRRCTASSTTSPSGSTATTTSSSSCARRSRSIPTTARRGRHSGSTCSVEARTRRGSRRSTPRTRRTATTSASSTR
ncbi:MAG: tetratricopeptide repeat protein [Polyangiales bacterium]